jgi:hypothetical protein
MNRFDGTAARQLDLVDEGDEPIVPHIKPTLPRRALHVLRRDVFLELTRRRRRAQIAARHELDKED